MYLKTVLKSGGEYKPEHVLRMADMLKRYVKCDYKFVCYTDKLFSLDGEIRPLIHGWPGWFSKLELFREVEDSFYIDLDMTICGDITDMVTVESSFMALRNMNPRIAGIGSAMMRWNRDYRYIYETFKSDPIRYMNENNKIGTNNHGDQSVVWKILDGKIEFFQDAFPKRIFRFNEKRGDVRVYYGRNRPF